MNPELIPVPGVLFSLAPSNDPGEYWVNMDTHGVGRAIGLLTPCPDGRLEVNTCPVIIGHADSPEAGMWACIRAWLGTPGNLKFLDAGFTPLEAQAGT